MKISTTVQQSPPKHQPLPQTKESKPAPFIDAYRASDKIWDFGMGALPGVGVMAHMKDAFFGPSVDTNISTAGMLLNATGTLSGAVALGQLAFGANPGLALGITAATLGTSGFLNAMVE